MPRIRFSLRGLALAAVTIGAAGLAGDQAAFAYWRTLPPGAAPHFAAGDARIVVDRINRAMAGGEVSTAERRSLAAAARAILRSDPLAPTAVSTLGKLDRDPVRGLALVKATERMTRRDGPTELMLIQAAAQADDLPEVLAHYNRLFLIDLEAYPLLRRVLARGLSEPAIREGLVAYAGQPWFKPFLLEALGKHADPSSVIALLALAKPRMTRAELVENVRQLSVLLAQANRFAELRELSRVLPEDLQRQAADFGFGPSPRPLEGSALGWMLESAPNGEAALTSAGALEVWVAPEMRLVAARRYTFLEPGNYALTQTIRNDTGASPARLEWQVACLDGKGGGQATVSPTGGSASGQGRTRLLVTVSKGCFVQAWALQASGSLSQDTSRASLAGLTLTPA